VSHCHSTFTTFARNNIYAGCQSANRRFEFHEGDQLFIRTHNETLSVVAMCVCNPDRSPVGINRCDAAPTPTGFASAHAAGNTVYGSGFGVGTTTPMRQAHARVLAIKFL
jgi:hypothetical protein